MPTRKGRDLRPGDRLVPMFGHKPLVVTEVRWTSTGLGYLSRGDGVTPVPLDPDGDYEVAYPEPTVSLDWSETDQAWVVSISTAGIPDGEHRVLVNLDGAFINEEA